MGHTLTLLPLKLSSLPGQGQAEQPTCLISLLSLTMPARSDFVAPTAPNSRMETAGVRVESVARTAGTSGPKTQVPRPPSAGEFR